MPSRTAARSIFAVIFTRCRFVRCHSPSLFRIPDGGII
jgi:hypothetical protein